MSVEKYFNTYTKFDEGGKGVVLKVEKNTTGQGPRVYALKLYRNDKGVQDEYDLIKPLCYSGMVPCYHSFYQTIKYQNSRYTGILQDFIEGINLENIYFSGPQKSIDETELKHLFLMVAKDIQFLHSQGIAHRDIKTANFIKKDNDQVIILDFDAACSDRVACLGIKGTYDYMAPEIVKLALNFRNEMYSSIVLTLEQWKQSDIWSAGVLFYIITNGYLPFGKVTEESHTIMLNIINDKKNKWSENVNKSIKNIINKCMNKNPNERPTVDELVRMIEKI